MSLNPLSETPELLLRARQLFFTWPGSEFPAGTLEPNEQPLACAKREITEEVGHGIDARGQLRVTSRDRP